MGVISNGTTLLDAGALDSGVATGAMTLLSTVTASSSATVSFTSGINSTYKEYIFKFINVLPASDGVKLKFNLSIDGGSNYNVTKTAANFYAGHLENDSATGFGYDGGLGQSTNDAFGTVGAIGSAADEGCSGFLHLFDPSNTTFVKHFISKVTIYGSNPQSQITYGAGYANTTSAVNAARFNMESGNIASGTIKLYGVS